HRVDEAELLEIFRRHRIERGEIADRFMEAVIGTALEQIRLRIVSAIIDGVAELMMRGVEIAVGHLKAGLHPQIVLAVDAPSRGVAYDFAIARSHDHGAGPK